MLLVLFSGDRMKITSSTSGSWATIFILNFQSPPELLETITSTCCENGFIGRKDTIKLKIPLAVILLFLTGAILSHFLRFLLYLSSSIWTLNFSSGSKYSRPGSSTQICFVICFRHWVMKVPWMFGRIDSVIPLKMNI